MNRNRAIESLTALCGDAHLLHAEKCRRDFKYFLKYGWPQIEPSTRFVDNWHMGVLTEHLEGVSRGQLQDVIFNVPYRTCKSTIVSVLWQPWDWLQNASTRWLTFSNRADLATRDALRSRRLIESPWFQNHFPGAVKLTGDQNQKTRFENSEKGVRVALGVTGAVTGEGGDRIVIDDPHDAKVAMYSNVEREAVLNAYDQGIATRRNDPMKSSVVLIMQRLHEKDLAGHLLETGTFTNVVLPMEYDPRRSCMTVLKPKGFGGKARDGKFSWDPRKEDGELLWPERCPADWVAKEKKRLGSFGASGQLQQQPAPDGGGIVQMKWFQRYGVLPDRSEWIRVIQFWDTAQKGDELTNAPWVGGTWIQTKTALYLVRLHREWMDYPTGKRAVKNEFEWARTETGLSFRPNAVVIEDKSTGASLIQELRHEGIPVVPFQPEGDKITRMAVETPAIEAGQVYLPKVAGWLNDYERELSLFPSSETKDQVDMTSMALKYFRLSARGPSIRSL